jgi:hypothetical protein
MPLLRDKLDETKLKSIPFGNDRPDGGSSNQPYIQTPSYIVSPGLFDISLDVGPKAFLGNDFLLRGGSLGTAAASANDVIRLTKFLNPLAKGASLNGALFVAKQLLLERQNVDVYNGFNRIYNPLGTVAQVGVLATGYHLNKQGLNVFRDGYFNGGDTGYFKITKQTDVDNESNRLSLLFRIKTSDSATEGEIVRGKARYGITSFSDDVNLIRYPGGPGSFLGIGKTNIRIQNALQFKTPEVNFGTNITKNEDQPSSSSLYLTPTDGYIPGSITTIETKLNISRTSFSRKRNGTDKIKNPNLSISPDQTIPGDGDIINFYFELINNDGTNNNTKIPLRAYIEDFGDNFTGEWDAFKYMGRAENFYRYKGFNRDFNINFIVPTLSRTDLITNYQKLNALTWLTMPDYSDVGYIRGNLAYFTIGDYFNRAVIVMKSISFTPIMEMGFDINRDEEYSIFENGADLYTGQLPKGIRVSCNMIPLTQNTGTGNDKDLFYTPQRGEAFIGNRTHVIKDRPDTIGAQYAGEKAIKPAYEANNPDRSEIFTTIDPPTTPDNSSNVPTANRSLMRG